MITEIIIYLCIGLLSGFLSGMFGIGGGSVRIPLLNLAGLPLLSAFGINLLLYPFHHQFDRIAPRFAQRINPHSHSIVAGSLFLNIVTGMRGGSGGSLFPPFLRAMRLDIHRAIATSLFVTIFTAIAAVIIYWHRGDIILLPAIFVLIGSMIGARIGSKISLETKPQWLEIGLMILIIALAFIIIYKAL